jgi:alpha-1,6-mannosyltransferase
MTLHFGEDREGKREHPLSAKSLVVLCGLALAGLFVILSFLSDYFSPETGLEERPVLALVLIMTLSGAIYLFAIVKALNSINARNMLVFVLFIGAVLRLTMFFSTPILEDDYNRYLWDGAVTANGMNPYKYSPEEVIQNKDAPGELLGLADESGDIIRRINHPHIRSIYPPVTQALFALSYMIKPWSLLPWRAILLIFDIAALALILYSLRLTCLPLIYSIIYWWNPLLVKEIYNSAHLDVLVLPFALGGVILAINTRYMGSMLSLAGGIGVKLWPALLAPLVLRPIISNPGRLLRAAVLFVIAVCVLFIPLYLSLPDASSGLIAYGTSWENNDSIFRILIFFSDFFLKTLGYETYQKYSLARVFAVALTILWIFTMTYRRPAGGDFFKRSLFIIAFVFLVSPTEFPWYYTWLLPFLAVEPRFSLLTLTALLPLYYLRYYFEPRGDLGVFTNVIIWLEFVPVWVLLFIEWKSGRREVTGRLLL